MSRLSDVRLNTGVFLYISVENFLKICYNRQTIEGYIKGKDG